MKTTVHFDSAAIAPDEAVIRDFGNELLMTLVKFAWAIRDHRRDPHKIRETLIWFIFNITPADRVTVVPCLGQDNVFEPVGQNRNGSASIHLKRALIEHASESRDPIMSPTVICFPMRAFQSRQGVVYAAIADPSRSFERKHLDLLLGLASVAAIAIEHAGQMEVLEARNKALQEDEDARYHLMGESPQMVALKALINQAASSDSTVLIVGESGTGKELVARAIHRNSKRANGPFIAINCGAIPEGTAESELFGHEKGAFTGAIAQKKGRFEAAQGGTLFLDEVGELSPALQVKLLRVLQEKEADPVGGTKPIKLNIRIVAATNQDLERAVATGKFREDLYYRLKVVNVAMPTLRERCEDILLLARHFISRYVADTGRRLCMLSTAAGKMLEEHHWPGNVRELQNVIERAIVLTETGILVPADFPAYLHKAGLGNPESALKELQDNNDRERLKAALIKTDGDCLAAGQIIGKSQATVYRWVEQFEFSHLLKRPRR